MKLEKLNQKGERYSYDETYTLEVWIIEDINNGRLFEFYLTSSESIYKLYMYGMRMWQESQKKLYTKREMIEMAMANVDNYIDQYEEESNAVENMLNDMLMKKM